MSIKLRNILIDYGKSIAVDDLSLSVETGELVSLLGPSGCGKSTTLNAIAGLLQVSKGQILFDGVDVTKSSPQKRNIGLVFQNYALYPHLSVFQNIAFPLYQNGSFKKEIKLNNSLVQIEIEDLKFGKGVIAKEQLISDIYKILAEFIKSEEEQFDKLATDFLKTVQTISDKFALTIYDDKELNTFRSRIYIQWYDAARAFVENQRVKMYKTMLESITNAINIYALENSEVKDTLTHVVKNFAKKIKLLSIDKTVKKANAIEEAVQTHIKTLVEEIKVVERLAKMEHKNVEWKVSLEERDQLIAQQKTEYDLLTSEFIFKMNENKSEIANSANYIKFQNEIDMSSRTFAKSEFKNVKTKQEFEAELAAKNEQIKSFRKEVKNAVNEVSEKVEITSQLKKKPSELSGGQQQRVAIARAIVKKPKVLLLDEPLSNLDAKLRVTTREWIKKFQKETGITTIFVTHDQEEAMSISDKIFIMSKGLLQQADKPMNVYETPANKFVANFIGTPSMNFFEDIEVDSTGKIKLNGEVIGTSKKLKGQTITVGIRPEHIELVGSNSTIQYSNKNPIPAKVDVIERLGRSDYLKVILKNGKEIRVIFDSKTISSTSDQNEVGLNIIKGKIYIFNNNGEKELIEII